MRVLGEECIEVAVTLDGMARFYGEQGSDSDRNACYERAITILRQIGSQNSYRSFDSLFLLADILYDRGRYNEAEPIYREVLERAHQIMDKESPEMFAYINKLGLCCYKQKKYDEAELVYSRGFAISRNAFGYMHTNVALYFHNMSAISDERDCLDQAVSYCKKAQEIWSQTIGDSAPLFARSLNRLAGIYVKQGNMSQAESLYRKALSIYERIGETNDPDAISTIKKLERF